MAKLEAEDFKLSSSESSSSRTTLRVWFVLALMLPFQLALQPLNRVAKSASFCYCSISHVAGLLANLLKSVSLQLLCQWAQLAGEPVQTNERLSCNCLRKVVLRALAGLQIAANRRRLYFR